MNGDLLSWHFPTTDDGEEEGINDSVRETFEGNHEYHVARECVQNSLDARREDNDEPVKVRFERTGLPSSQLPGHAQLKDVVERAKDYSSDQDNSEYYYGLAQDVLNRPEISVLKVSDYNTEGLCGDDRDKQGSWYKLVKASGVNSMHGNGGGSFGIGKGAPFAASGLRTVFYSTIDGNGQYAFQGKARLSSFENSYGDIRRGMGQLGIKEGGKGSVQ